MSENGMDQNDIVASGPGQAFMHFSAMEELLDKLKFLDYDQEFVKELKHKSISRHYFAIQTNPGEQFYVFSSLAAWLIRKCGKDFEQPQEYDDPNSTISTILDFVRDNGGTVDFAPNRLKQGVGEHAIFVLTYLVNHLTKSKSWSRAEPKEEQSNVVDEVEDESELLLEKVEEEMAASLSDDDVDDDDENVLNLDDLRNIQLQRNLLQQQRPEQMLQSSVRSEEWQVELERVLPQLRVTVRTDARDWRTHLEHMQKHHAGLQENFTAVKSQLDELDNDISGALDKITNREKHLNIQVEPLLGDYRARQEELDKITQQYKTLDSGVIERTKNLTTVTEQLDSVKKEMEERSSSMTDGSPLINIKKAMTRIKTEMKEMDIRLGVLDSEVLLRRLQHKTNQNIEVNSPAVYL